ncbi:translation initiation factor eIF-2B subunit beta [Diaphorina citri]|uniref:Translation initiation factor eIF2B subunit beta n=1 Tax=Diaphorina citri TaxID=121845 RepID=A0A3Q0J098_DIACI|nr:translation initiation factor eIF-2B subunit beta [Diaphorina citri]
MNVILKPLAQYLLKLSGSFQISTETVILLKKIIEDYQWKNAREIIHLISHYGVVLSKQLALESCVTNMVRRILKIIREEYSTCVQKKSQEDDNYQESLHKLVVSSDDEATDFANPTSDTKSQEDDNYQESLHKLVVSSDDEVLIFLLYYDNVSSQACEHIHSNEIILTLGYSKIVELFLKNAAQHRKFQCIVMENSPENKGHELAVSLAKSKIQTVLIPDSAMFGLISRVNKIIIGTHTVMANGGLRSVCGTHAVALAAQHYSIPGDVFVHGRLWLNNIEYASAANVLKLRIQIPK